MIEIGEEVDIANFKQCGVNPDRYSKDAYYHSGRGLFLGLVAVTINAEITPRGTNTVHKWSKKRIAIKVLRENGGIEFFHLIVSSCDEIKFQHPSLEEEFKLQRANPKGSRITEEKEWEKITNSLKHLTVEAIDYNITKLPEGDTLLLRLM